jgi:peptide/nickel transport system substrate-binding protein
MELVARYRRARGDSSCRGYLPDIYVGNEAKVMTIGTPRRDGKLTMVLAADPAGLDPVQLQGVQNWAEAIAVAAVYDTLLYPDALNSLQPKIATSLTTSDGGRAWTLTLRSGVRFSDGTPVNSEAVRFNWARLADPVNRAVVGNCAALIESMQVCDATTMQITLRMRVPHWDRVVARFLSSIGSPAAIAAAGEAFARAPVGAGPFMLAEWVRGDHMTFVRNPHYWQPDKPYLAEMTVITGITDAAPKYECMISGRAQVALEPLGENLTKFRQQPDRYLILTTPEGGGGSALALNVTRAPFDDQRVRRALALALDSAEFVEQAGYGDPQMVMTTIDRAGTPYHHPEIRLPARDITMAQQLIDARVAESGAPVRFTLETFANEGHIREANVVKRMLEFQLTSLAVTVAIGSAPDVIGKMRNGEYQAMNSSARWSDPTLDLPALFASASKQNVMRYSNGRVDAALERLVGASDRRAIAEAHHDVLRQVLHDLPVIWLSHKEAFHVVDRRAVHDWRLFYSLRPLIEDAWLAQT